MKKILVILMIACISLIGAELEEEVLYDEPMVSEEVTEDETIVTEEPELIISKYIQNSESYRLLKSQKVDVENIYYVANTCYKKTPDIVGYIASRLNGVTDFEEAKNLLVSSKDFLAMFSHYCRGTNEFVKLDSDMMFAHSTAEIEFDTKLVKSLETSLATLIAYSFLDLYLKQ